MARSGIVTVDGKFKQISQSHTETGIFNTSHLTKENKGRLKEFHCYKHKPIDCVKIMDEPYIEKIVLEGGEGIRKNIDRLRVINCPSLKEIRIISDKIRKLEVFNTPNLKKTRTRIPRSLFSLFLDVRNYEYVFKGKSFNVEKLPSARNFSIHY